MNAIQGIGQAAASRLHALPMRKPMPARDDVHQMPTQDLLRLFLSLEAPTLEEMEGEYAAKLLTQTNRLADFACLAASNPVMHWMCKSFRPVDRDTGRGYNTFLMANKVVQRYPMLTLIGPSRFDGRPAYQLVYRHFHSLCGTVHMVDEVRRLGPGRYLGIGTWGFTDAQRQIPYPFLLEGPVAAYRGDIGRARKNFAIGQRELPALV